MRNKRVGDFVTETGKDVVHTIIGLAHYLNGQELALLQEGNIDEESFDLRQGKWVAQDLVNVIYD